MKLYEQTEFHLGGSRTHCFGGWAVVPDSLLSTGHICDFQNAAKRTRTRRKQAFLVGMCMLKMENCFPNCSFFYSLGAVL